MFKNPIISRKNNEETVIDKILKPILKRISLIGLGVKGNRAKEMSMLKRGNLELPEGISELYNETTNVQIYRERKFSFPVLFQ